ncbi:MAG: chromosome segregation protein SMC [Candidatus Melainabacteria bacterium]
MYIESIELDNFKSFGERNFIPLFPGFTTVSGPNGSGKSNIIDSLLFALGLSTNKTMRAERLTDLMNNLSGKRETQVTVTLYDDVREAQLKVSRRIRLKLNGQYESSYFLNSKPATLAEIHDQLALRNISPNAYNVVMQGDVTRIISMSPLERRRIIDELAGVADFDRKIDEAKQEIAQARESLERQTILLSEFSDRLESLKKEKDQAVKYAELRKRRNYLERLFRQVRIRELEQRVLKIQADTTDKIQKKADLIAVLSEVSEKFLEVEAKSLEAQTQLDYLNKVERLKIQSELDLWRERVTKDESGIEFLNKQTVDYKAQIERIGKESKLGEKKINELDKQIKSIEGKEKAQQDELEKIQRQYESVQSKIIEKSQNDNFSTSRVFELQEEINSLQNSKASHITEKALCEQNLARLEKEIFSLRGELEKGLNQLKSSASGAQNSQAQNMSEKIGSVNRHLNRLKDELRDTEQEMKDRTAQAYEYQHELSKLEMKRQVSEEQNWGRAIETVLRANVPGVHGVMAQLANVSAQYSLALEVAAGARLKSIIVEDDRVGSELIEILRRQNAGRATFLPLNKLKEPYIERLPADAKSPSSGIIDWAINLVKCDSVYLAAFGYAFGSTLVVKDLQSGRKYLGSYRMVSLQGDLLEKSGAMTGGSSPRESGIHFGVEEGNKAAQLTKQIEGLQKRIQSMQASIQELKTEIRSTEVELDEMKGEWAGIKAQEEINTAGLINLKSQVEINRKRLTEAAAERDQIENQLKGNDSEIIKLDRLISKLSDSLAAEGARVRDAGLENLINESQELEFERKKLEVACRNLETEKAEFIKNIEVVKGTLNRGHDEIIQAESQIIQLREELGEKEKSLLANRNSLRELENIFLQMQAQIDSLQKVKDDLSVLLIDLTKRKTEISENIKAISNEIADAKIKLIDIEERLHNLKQEELSAEIQGEQQDPNQQLNEQNAVNEFDKKMSEQQVRDELEKIERKMTSMEPINMKAIDEYTEVLERLQEVKTKCEDLSNEQSEIESRINNYTEHKQRSFFEAFNDVNKHFQEIFAELSFGHGELTLENKEDPFKGGLVIQARPRNKKMQRLESMSGGEKSLTALSFIFALQWHNPAPFYAFDEVDMFLDGLNAERLAKMVKKQSTLAQFVVVSLRKPMIQASERAIGVCLGRDGFSKVAGMRSKDEIIKESEKQEKEHLLKLKDSKKEIVVEESKEKAFA